MQGNKKEEKKKKKIGYKKRKAETIYAMCEIIKQCLF